MLTLKPMLSMRCLGSRACHRHNKGGTARGYWHLLRAYVVPAIGRLRADCVTIADLAKLHHDMINEPRSANHMLACVSAMTNWAAVRGLWPKAANPTQGIERYEEKAHERFLKPSEVQSLGQALSTLDEEIEAAERGEVPQGDATHDAT